MVNTGHTCQFNNVTCLHVMTVICLVIKDKHRFISDTLLKQRINVKPNTSV